MTKIHHDHADQSQEHDIASNTFFGRWIMARQSGASRNQARTNGETIRLAMAVLPHQVVNAFPNDGVAPSRFLAGRTDSRRQQRA